MSRVLRNFKNFRLAQFLTIPQIPLIFKLLARRADHSKEMIGLIRHRLECLLLIRLCVC